MKIAMAQLVGRKADDFVEHFFISLLAQKAREVGKQAHFQVEGLEKFGEEVDISLTVNKVEVPVLAVLGELNAGIEQEVNRRARELADERFRDILDKVEDAFENLKDSFDLPGGLDFQG